MLRTLNQNFGDSQHYALMALFGEPFSESLWTFSKWTIINVQFRFSKRLFQNGFFHII